MQPILILAVLLVLAAVALFWLARRRFNRLGLPAGRVIYADTGDWRPLEQPLYDRALALTGRPDYLVETPGGLVPVEVKSSAVTHAPYDAHIFQLAAYCLLVERVYGVRPPYGILRYPNRTFAIDYTPELEQALFELLDEMRADERRATVPRSHTAPARCRSCGFNGLCDQRLG